MNQKDTCEIFCYDEEKVNRVQNDLKQVDMADISQVLKAIADENRAKITYALSLEDELCVCDIANILGVTVANASHHLRTLYNQGVVTYRKEGKLSFYTLQGEHIKQILGIALAHKKEVPAHV